MMSREAHTHTHTRGPRYDGDSHGKHDGSTINVIVTRFMVKVVGSAAFLPRPLATFLLVARESRHKHVPRHRRQNIVRRRARVTRGIILYQKNFLYSMGIRRWMRINTMSALARGDRLDRYLGDSIMRLTRGTNM